MLDALYPAQLARGSLVLLTLPYHSDLICRACVRSPHGPLLSLLLCRAGPHAAGNRQQQDRVDSGATPQRAAESQGDDVLNRVVAVRLIATNADSLDLCAGCQTGLVFEIIPRSHWTLPMCTLASHLWQMLALDGNEIARVDGTVA